MAKTALTPDDVVWQCGFPSPQAAGGHAAAYEAKPLLVVDRHRGSVVAHGELATGRECETTTGLSSDSGRLSLRFHR